MKLSPSVILSLAAVQDASSSAVVVADAGVPPEDDAATGLLRSRELQNNNYNYNGGYNGGCENYEECMRYQMAQRTFTFTGCSTVTNKYGRSNAYVTFRMCDECNENRNTGCNDANGDYVVSMATFGESFSEYWEQMTYQDRDAAPFSCVGIDEYAEAQLYNNNNNNYNNNNNNQGGYNGQQQQQQWYNNNNVEYYVGPVCTDGTKIETGLFYDEDCTNPVQDTSVEDVLGFAPSNTDTEPPHCVACMQTNYGNNNNNGGGGGGQGELNPLCDRMMENAGRCDRTRKTTQFDQAWQNNRQGGGNNNNNNGYAYGDACSFVDGLPHMRRARRARRAATTAIWIGVVASLAGVALVLHRRGYLDRFRGMRVRVEWPGGHNPKTTTTADYHRETDTTPALT